MFCAVFAGFKAPLCHVRSATRSPRNICWLSGRTSPMFSPRTTPACFGLHSPLRFSAYSVLPNTPLLPQAPRPLVPYSALTSPSQPNSRALLYYFPYPKQTSSAAASTSLYLLFLLRSVRYPRFGTSAAHGDPQLAHFSSSKTDTSSLGIGS